MPVLIFTGRTFCVSVRIVGRRQSLVYGYFVITSEGHEKPARKQSYVKTKHTMARPDLDMSELRGGGGAYKHHFLLLNKHRLQLTFLCYEFYIE